MRRLRLGRAAAAALGLVPFVASCDRDPAFGPESRAEGSVSATAYYEYDSVSGFGGPDRPATGLRFQVLLPGSGTAVAQGVADGEGRIVLGRVPVGTYDLRVDPAFLGDTLLVVRIDTTRVTLQPDQEFSISVAVTPPTYSLDELRQLPEGRRGWFTGMALNGRGSSIEGAVHVLEEGAGAIRAIFLAATSGSPGDSVRVLGRVSGTGVQRVLEESRLLVVAQSVRPILPLEVGFAEARSAGGGELAARFVVIRSGEVIDVATTPFVGQRVTVSNGTQPIDVFLPFANGFGAPVEVGSDAVSVAGLLIPDPANPGSWRIVPRGPGDARFIAPPPPPPP